MNVRTLATALIVALVAAACGLPEEGSGSSNVSHQTSPDEATNHASWHWRWGDTLEEVAAQVDLTVLVRATDNAWTEPPPGPPKPWWWDELDEDMRDGMSYHWREYEVMEVLSGSYDNKMLNYGNFLERTVAGETYLLFISVLLSESGEPQYSVQHFTGPAPPYHLTLDNILLSTDPTVHSPLDVTLTLADARARLSD